MGGFGSGTHGGAQCTDRVRRLDVRQLARDGLLRPGTSSCLTWEAAGRVAAKLQLEVQEGAVRVDSTVGLGGLEQRLRFWVYLSHSRCHLGGMRLWWLCPMQQCQKRVALLYGGALFICRDCMKLAYRSQRETAWARALRRANKLRARLGWPPGVISDDGHRPPGMHQRTYDRLRMTYYAAAGVALTGLAPRLNLMRRGLEKVQKATAGS